MLVSTPLQFPEKIGALTDTTSQLQSAQAAAASARTITYVGAALGALGMILGAWCFIKRK